MLIAAVITMTGAHAGVVGCVDGDSVRLRESILLDDGQTDVSLAQVAILDGPLAEALSDLVVYAINSDQQTTHRLRIDEVRRAIGRSGANLGLLAVSGSQCLIRPSLKPKSDEEAEGRPSVLINPYEGMTPAEEFYGQPTLRGLIARNVAHVQFARETGMILLRFDERDAEMLDRMALDREYELLPMASPDTSRIPIQIMVYDGLRVERTLHTTVDVAIERNVVITTRTISGGRTIGADDVALVKQIIDPHPTAPVDSLEAVIGMEARGRLVKGQIIRIHDLEQPVAKSRGAKVILRARSGAFVFRMPGQLLEDARPGQIVRVRRLTDRIELTGRLEADGEINISATESADMEDRK